MIKKIIVTINNKKIRTTSGKTILQVINENRIEMPSTFCSIKKINPSKYCYFCLVEIKGTEKPVPSCITEAINGMEIITNSKKIKDLRTTAIELSF